MEEWKEYKLGEILLEKGYIRGPFGSSLRRGDLLSEGIPVYEQQHAIYGKRDFRFYISEDKYNEMKRFTVYPNDIIISCSGTVGEVSLIKKEDPKGIISQALLLLRSDATKILPEYLLYFFKSAKGHNSILSRSSGSVQVNIARREVIEGITLNLPNLEIQDKIVSILKSLDDKIENNRKINENLEQQAQALFKSWFVDFEPFRDQPFVESELGMIPEGWRVGTLSEIVEYSKSRISIKDINTHTYVSTENMLANKQGITEASGLPNVENVTRFEIGDVLISNIRPYFKKLHYCNHIGGCSGDVMCFHPLSKEYRGYLYCTLYDDVFFEYVMSGSKGTKMPRGDKRQIMNYRIIIPSNSIINQFNNYVLLLLSQIDNNRKQSHRLSQLRDTLLPKLMSGEIKL